MADLSDLKRAARIDDLLDRVRTWAEAEPAWTPDRTAARLLRAVTNRAEGIRDRLTLPLVVATFGGSGTGKSTLVNALVGEEVSTSGKMRPTTTTPVLIAAPDVDLQQLSLPLDELNTKRVDAGFLSEIVLVDCPDPDTSGEASSGVVTNLGRLRSILPHCDVLLYVSTQQKYKQAAVLDELIEIADGCRVLFVQTRADIDADIRDDWRSDLEDRFTVPEIFFVDAPGELNRTRTGEPPGEEFARLRSTLRHELARSERLRIREANLFDLLADALRDAGTELEAQLAAIRRLAATLDGEDRRLFETLTTQLTTELLRSRHLWERRLLGRVTEVWGASPFSTLLRVWHGLGGLIAQATLLRARSPAQLAVVGALEGARQLRNRSREAVAEERIDRIDRFGLDDVTIRESLLIVRGAANDADFRTDGLLGSGLETARDRAARFESDFLGSARGQIETVIGDLAGRHTRWYVRWRYELLFVAYLLFILYRVGRNFFYDSFLAEYMGATGTPEPLLTVDFYIPALLFFVVWSGLLVLLYTRRLHRGLNRHIERIAEELSQRQLGPGLYRTLRESVDDTLRRSEELRRLGEEVDRLRDEVPEAGRLGAPKRSA